MEGFNKPNQLPKEAQIMYQRIPEELRHELDALPLDKIVKILEALNKLHHAIEAEVYKFTLQLI